jgi:aryl-alcohol dehydrogenase
MHGTRADGSVTIRLSEAPVRSAFFQQSSFATYSIATERNVVRLPREFDLNVAAALSCGVSTGAGVVANVIKPDRGSSFAVIGAGAVGLAALLAACDAGCEPIVAVDIHDNRLRLAAELGASHTFQWSDRHLASSIREVTSGVGVDGVIDTTGLAEVAQVAFPALAAHGTYCFVGTPHRGAMISVDMAVALNGRGIRGSIQGDNRPQQFVPRLLELYRSGRFPIDALIQLYEPSEINAAARDMESGTTIKPVIRLSALHEGA